MPPTPWVANSLPSCFVAGKTSSFVVKAQDADSCDTVRVIAGGLPAGANFGYRSGSNPVEYVFSWRPTDSQRGLETLVAFSAIDDGNGASPQEFIPLKVPQSSGQLPTVTSAAPTSGLVGGGTVIYFQGQVLSRAPTFSAASLWEHCMYLWLQTFISSNNITCTVPSNTLLNDAQSVQVSVSNQGSCDDWLIVIYKFDYLETCDGECSLCPVGSYRSPTSCELCPAGRYGTINNETQSGCTGPCSAGYYCPAGSTTPTPANTKCPAGRYGDTTGLGTSSCSGPCPAGYYCSSGTVNPVTLCAARSLWRHWAAKPPNAPDLALLVTTAMKAPLLQRRTSVAPCIAFVLPAPPHSPRHHQGTTPPAVPLPLALHRWSARLAHTASMASSSLPCWHLR